MKRLLLFCLASFLTGCSPGSLEDFQREGESRCRTLVLKLQQIETHEQLLRAESDLKKEFEKLVDLMIEAREFQLQNFDEDLPEAIENPTSTALKEELRRIYTIEGGREMIERTQQEALVRLDAYERARKLSIK